jgi:hypothetical protein
MEEQGEPIKRFMQDIAVVPWFRDVGQPLPSDTKAQQLRCWEDWPGPEDAAVFELSKRQQALYDELLANAPPRRAELENLWGRISRVVIPLASAAVPYDASRDAWHGPNAAVWQAAWTTGLVAWCVLLGRQIPAELEEQWHWFMLGRWPCGYAVVWADDRLGPLLVF